MANNEKIISELKSKIEKVILESYKKTKSKNFVELNFVFPKNISVIGYLKNKIKVFNNLDEYSLTFLSIFTRAKITLREFKDNEFEGNHIELLRLVLTLPEELGYGNLKSTSVKYKEDYESLIKKEIKSLDDNDKILPENKEAKKVFIKQGLTGKSLSKQNKQRDFEIEELNEIDFEDEEYTQIENLDDIEL